MTAVSQNKSRVSSETIRARRTSAADSMDGHRTGTRVDVDYTGPDDRHDIGVNGRLVQSMQSPTGIVGITTNNNEIHNHNLNLNSNNIIHNQLPTLPLPVPIQSFPARKLSIPPLPRTLSTDTRQAAIAQMQARQETWNRSAARSSTSSDSAASHHSGLSTASNGSHSIASSSPSSPITQNVTNTANPAAEGARAGPSGALVTTHHGQKGESSTTGLKTLKPSASGQSGSKSGSGSGSGSGKNPSTGKEVKTRTRKKVAKACLACQKSHLTCDESESSVASLLTMAEGSERPCTRCLKKGVGDACVEGVRKKAKYLLEGDERGESESWIMTLPACDGPLHADNV